MIDIISVGACYYQGKQYSQGQTWDDGCSYECTCDDAAHGRYSCYNKYVLELKLLWKKDFIHSRYYNGLIRENLISLHVNNSVFHIPLERTVTKLTTCIFTDSLYS